MTTGFYSDERTFWHCTGVQALIAPIGGWVQPPALASGADGPETKRRFYNLAKASGMIRLLHAPDVIQPASDADLLRVHTPKYIEDFKAASAANGGELGASAGFSRGGFDIAAISAGLAKRCVFDVMRGEVENGYALSRPAGHHCLPDQSMGLCLLSNIAIALEAARAELGAMRVAVVDWDVHHGNGTEHIYYGRDDTLTISLHQDQLFPSDSGYIEDRGEGPGLGYNVNVPLPPGSGHHTYLHAMKTIVVPALEKFQPDLIVVASGIDGNIFDPLGRMMCYSETYREMTMMMMRMADRLCGRRLAIVHEGGYSEYYVPFCGHAILEALSGRKTEAHDPDIAMYASWQPQPRVLEFQKSLVDEMAVQLA